LSHVSCNEYHYDESDDNLFVIMHSCSLEQPEKSTFSTLQIFCLLPLILTSFSLL